MTPCSGLHHITAIAGDPRRNLDFYTRVLGMRLVKRTVNFDDPGTFHLYYGDERGSPGTILTFFPWTGLAQGRSGPGEAVDIGFLAPPSAAGFWSGRFAEFGVAHDAPVERLGDRALYFRDPDGLRLSLVFSPDAAAQPGWSEGGVPVEHALRGIWNVTILAGDPAASAGVLTQIFGWRKAEVDEAAGLTRFTAPGAELGAHLDLRAAPGASPSRLGAGSIHHVAFRAGDDVEQAERVALLRRLGIPASEQKDRCYFRSVYFREPSGALFEIATDDPGFQIDEALASLGEEVKLPPWLEPSRAAIMRALPPLD